MDYKVEILVRDTKETIIKKYEEALSQAILEIKELKESHEVTPIDESILKEKDSQIESLEVEIEKLKSATTEYKTEKLGLFLGLVEGKADMMVQDTELTSNKKLVEAKLSLHSGRKTKLIEL